MSAEVINPATGEVLPADAFPVDLTRGEAERITKRISLKLDTIADNYQAVMPLIREAVERNAAAALGYSGVSAYVADRFGGALQRLGVETRREVVKELTAGGMSNRATASVLGVDERTVRNDRLSGAENSAPESEPRPVTGLDGKTYQPARPEPVRHLHPVPDPRPGPTMTDRRQEATRLLDRICLLAAPPPQPVDTHRGHAAAWAHDIDRDDTTIARLDTAISYLTLLREELAR